MAATTFTPESYLSEISAAADSILSQLPSNSTFPKLAIICGSGLGSLPSSLATSPAPVSIPYTQITHFPTSKVPGHSGTLVLGLLGASNTPVAMLVGRTHFYEGLSVERTGFATRVLAKLGVETIVVTNAAGGLNGEYNVGDIVVLGDHINVPGLAGAHPLRGPNIDEIGTRFPALSDAYDLGLRRNLHRSWRALRSEGKVSEKRRVHEGVYAFVSGPSFETRAECRFLRLLGADVVGMSTVPEVIVARHAGLRVLAMSLVTNCSVLDPGPRGDDESALEGKDDAAANAIIEEGKANHEEVLESGREAAKDMQELVARWVDVLAA